MRPSTKAWIGIGLGVAAYDALCPQEEQLSKRFDEWMDKPITRLVSLIMLGAVAGHLTRAIPEQIDGIHHTAELCRYIARKVINNGQTGLEG